ncbi:GumC family protein [Methylobacterium planeticum]|uniref:non-specific protein-tyrosine kinase n=1 Tax=Methylobacterium planeticum TaxID=2615211 RepID=A0A6N6MFF8_9HYPH|nr:Wzz/FepE/Etk N-terminal domain-containing protein [Methylobacterium planeticum]KAB1069572.1 AAA family ATPase [Methylobacterium planeticum]
MLDRPSNGSHVAVGYPSEMRAEETVSLRQIHRFVRRYARTIAAAILIALVAGGLYLFFATPVFSAMAEILIDPSESQTVLQGPNHLEGPIDNARVESQIELLKSERISLRVIQELNLLDDPAFGPIGSLNPIALVRSLMRFGSEPQGDEEYRRLRGAVNIFNDGLTVRRKGTSYVIQVYYQSADPELAARIANTTVATYIREQIEAKSATARSGSNWLQERVVELRGQLNGAARAVEEFKARNNIVDAGNRGLLSEQQLSELSSQLILARARTAEARARVARIDEILRAGSPDVAVTESLGNQIITTLRQRYVETAAAEAELTARYGSTHPAAESRRAEMANQRKAIMEELNRIGEAYRSDFEVARTRETTLSSELGKLVGAAAQSKEGQVMLGELDTAALAYRRMYESFLQKFHETVQKESFPVSDSRIITDATRPLVPSQPRTILVLALALLLGSGAGVGTAMVQQTFDRSIRSPSQVRRAFDLDCLGIVPRVARPTHFGRTRSEASIEAVLEAPGSAFSNGLHEIKTSLDMVRALRNIRRVGILSAEPGAGKTILASNLAILYGLSGRRALVIDADLHGAGLSRAAPADLGLLEVLEGAVPVKAAICQPARMPYALLAASGEGCTSEARFHLGSERMRATLDTLQELFDLTLIDLPAFSAAVDARAVSIHLDAVILVVECGVTSVENVQLMLNAIAGSNVAVLGVVLNKADARIADES